MKKVFKYISTIPADFSDALIWSWVWGSLLGAIIITVGVQLSGLSFGARCAEHHVKHSAEWEQCVENLANDKPGW